MVDRKNRTRMLYHQPIESLSVEHKIQAKEEICTQNSCSVKDFPPIRALKDERRGVSMPLNNQYRRRIKIKRERDQHYKKQVSRKQTSLPITKPKLVSTFQCSNNNNNENQIQNEYRETRNLFWRQKNLRKQQQKSHDDDDDDDDLLELQLARNTTNRARNLTPNMLTCCVTTTMFMIMMMMIVILSNSTPAEGVDCFKCSSRNGSNPACEDPFHNLNTTRITLPVLPDPPPNVIYHTPCYAGKKGRDGLFPASACIKLTGTFDATGETLVVRHCALDSGTLTQDTELARMSHCGKFNFDGDSLKGCVLACPEDACNSAPPSIIIESNGRLPFGYLTITTLLLSLASIIASLQSSSKIQLSH